MVDARVISRAMKKEHNLSCCIESYNAPHCDISNHEGAVDRAEDSGRLGCLAYQQKP